MGIVDNFSSFESLQSYLGKSCALKSTDTLKESTNNHFYLIMTEQSLKCAKINIENLKVVWVLVYAFS